MEIKTGAVGQASAAVTEQNTACAAGSGTLAVFGTPFMAALMEQAAWQAAAPFLDPGQSTVGTMLSITHISPTPVGMTVTARAEITAVEGKKITYTVSASDDAGLIGQGTHARFVVNDERFTAKCYAKKQPL